MSELDKEIAAFQAERPALVKDAGKFVTYFNGKNQGIFATYAEALTKGYEVAGEEPFLVEQISIIPQVQQFSRAIAFENLAG